MPRNQANPVQAHLDKFPHIGVFSRPSMPQFDVKKHYGGVLANAAEFNQQVHLFWWEVGTAEEGIHKSVKDTLAKLDSAGVKYVYMEWPGLAHEWQLWRKCLNDFAPRLFH